MSSEEWPIAAPAADRPVEPARPAGADRLIVVRRDFFLAPSSRLSEQERALMTAMLDDLLSTLADEIVAGLPDGLDLIDAPDPEQWIARLSRSGALDRPQLIALLLRAADEQRVAGALAHPVSRGRALLLQRLVADPDGEVAAGTMAVVIARGRRRDRFGQPRLLFDDLPADEAVALAHLVAAALRRPLPAHPAIDRAFAASAETLLSRHDEGLAGEALNRALVRLLERADRLDDALVEDLLAEAEVALLAAVLARRAQVPDHFVWDELIGGDEGRLALVARLAGLQRPTAARLMADLGFVTGLPDAAAELLRFDRLGDEAVEERRGEWRLPAPYRQAREALDG